MSSGLTPSQFVKKWAPVRLPERASTQEHFGDLCRLFGVPTPVEADPDGDFYCFEKGAAVSGPASAGSKGDRGFADVWWKDKFAWEYKRKDKYKDLDEAYRQLCQYREALLNPPLLIVSDISRTEIHTNFTGCAKVVHTITLDEFLEPQKLALLSRVFTAPRSFKPGLTQAKITEEAAKRFARLARATHDGDPDSQDAARAHLKNYGPLQVDTPPYSNLPSAPPVTRQHLPTFDKQSESDLYVIAWTTHKDMMHVETPSDYQGPYARLCRAHSRTQRARLQRTTSTSALH